MAPTIVLENGAPMLLIGSPGGSSIIPYVAQALVGILDFGQDPQTAIDAPHVLNRNGPTLVEAGPEADATIAALTDLGQTGRSQRPQLRPPRHPDPRRPAHRRRRQAPRGPGDGRVIPFPIAINEACRDR